MKACMEVRLCLFSKAVFLFRALNHRLRSVQRVDNEEKRHGLRR